jgi:hypothetical protein
MMTRMQCRKVGNRRAGAQKLADRKVGNRRKRSGINDHSFSLFGWVKDGERKTSRWVFDGNSVWIGGYSTETASGSVGIRREKRTGGPTPAVGG